MTILSAGSSKCHPHKGSPRCCEDLMHVACISDQVPWGRQSQQYDLRCKSLDPCTAEQGLILSFLSCISLCVFGKKSEIIQKDNYFPAELVRSYLPSSFSQRFCSTIVQLFRALHRREQWYSWRRWQSAIYPARKLAECDIESIIKLFSDTLKMHWGDGPIDRLTRWCLRRLSSEYTLPFLLLTQSDSSLAGASGFKMRADAKPR